MKEILIIIAVIGLGIITSQTIGGIRESTPAENKQEIADWNRSVAGDGIVAN